MFESTFDAESKTDQQRTPMLFRRWRRLAGIGAITIFVLSCGFLLAGGGSTDPDPRPGNGSHVASTVLHLNLRPSGILSAADQKQSDAIDVKSIQETQAALVKSRVVINRALRQDGVSDLAIVKRAADPVDWLEDAVQVDFKESPEIMRLSLTGDKPQELALLLQAVADAYLDESVNDELESRSRRLQKLKDVAAKYEDMVRSKRRTLKEMAESASGHTTFVDEVNKQLLLDLKKEISHSRIARLSLQAKLNRLQATKSAVPPLKETRHELEDAISELAEKERLLADDGSKVFKEMMRDGRTGLDLEALREELQLTEDFANKLRRQAELLSIELTAPPRIQRPQGETPKIKKR